MSKNLKCTKLCTNFSYGAGIAQCCGFHGYVAWSTCSGTDEEIYYIFFQY